MTATPPPTTRTHFEVERPDPGRGRGIARPRRRGRRGRRGAARDLRGTALLRAAGPGPDAGRGPRHRRPHLRHLPGRLPDVRGPCLRGRRRASRSTRRSAPSAASCTAANGSRATRSTSTCSTPRLPRLPERDRAGPRPPRARRTGLALKKAGNRLVSLVGGRPIHPVTRPRRWLLPRPVRASELTALRAGARRRRSRSRPETVALVAGLEPPAFEREPRLVSLRHPTDYPMNEGRIVSTDGLDLAPGDWRTAFDEDQVALVERPPGADARRRGRTCWARRRGSPWPATGCIRARPRRSRATGLADEIRRQPVPQHRRARRRAGPRHRRGARHRRRLPPAGRAGVPWTPRSGVAAWATEAPRGLLFHRYELDEARTRRDRPDRPADEPEPGRHRGGPGRLRAERARPPARRGDPSARAADPELRPVHLVRDALPRPARRRPM